MNRLTVIHDTLVMGRTGCYHPKPGPGLLPDCERVNAALVALDMESAPAATPASPAQPAPGLVVLPTGHVIDGGGPHHRFDCPACNDESRTRALHIANDNPHRKGSRAALKWEARERAVAHGCDPRSDAYWSS